MNIYTSRTLMPPLEEYNRYLKRLWKSRYLTNDGEMVRELENKIKDYLKVKNVVIVSNGTLATMIAIKLLDIKKKVYVSPYSYVSTVSVPLWMGIKPYFIDLDEKWKSPAIVTHTYGIPEIVDVSPVIYDAAHAFGVKKDGKSIMSFGDISIVSFHATKLFQTIEGGAIITDNDDWAEKARWMRNFGHDGQYDYFGVGINAKMSEFHAAMGLCMIKRVDEIRDKYDQIIDKYNKALDLNWKDVSYYPVFYSSEKKLLNAIDELEANRIYPRRYFYPALNTIFNGKKCPVAEEKIKRVLCLPLYFELEDKDIKRIIKIVQRTL